MAIPKLGSRSERALFWLACRLAWLVARAANRIDQPGVTFVDVALAKATLGFVSGVAWVVDRLPLGDISPTRRGVHAPFEATRSNGHIQSTH